MSVVELKPAVPVYLLLKDDGTAETVVLGGDRCLCLFIDLNLLQAFYRSLYGGDFVTRDVGTIKFDGPDELRGFLRKNEMGLAGQGVRHFAVNPAPDRPIDRVPLHAFIDAGQPPGPTSPS